MEVGEWFVYDKLEGRGWAVGVNGGEVGAREELVRWMEGNEEEVREYEDRASDGGRDGEVKVKEVRLGESRK